MTRVKSKPARERAVFRRFAASVGDWVLPASVRSRKPPEPDIRCRTRDGVRLAFELVEIVDNSIRRGRADAAALGKTFRKQWLKARTRASRVDLSSAMIGIGFSNLASVLDKRTAIPVILQFLVTRRFTTEGKLDLDDWPEKPRALAWMAILRGEFRGPLFEVADGGAFIDPICKQVSRKLDRSYTTKLPLELLAYYDLQPTPWKRATLKPLMELLRSRLELSPFRRVWFFDVAKGKVLLVRPHFRKRVVGGGSLGLLLLGMRKP